MFDLYLRPSSIGYLIEFIFACVLSSYLAYLSFRPRKQQNGVPIKSLAGFFLTVAISTLILFIDTASLSPWRYYVWRAVVPCFGLGGVFLMYFIYHFPSTAPQWKNERRILRVLCGLYWIGEIVLMFYAWQQFAAGDLVSPHNLWVYAPVVLLYNWIVVVALRQMIRESRLADPLPVAWWEHLWQPRGQSAQQVKLMTVFVVFLSAISTTILLGLVNLVPIDTHETVFSVGAVIALYGFTFIYVNALPDYTSFMVKIVGGVLAVMLSLISILAWVITPVNAASYMPSRFILERESIRFSPNTNAGYDVSASPLQREEEAGGIRLALGRGETKVTPLPFQFTFFGRAWREVYVGEDGYIGFGGPITFIEALYTYGSHPTIFALFQDLETAPDDNSSGIFVRSDPTKWVVVWRNVRERYHPQDRDTVQLNLYPDGSFVITHNSLTLNDGYDIQAWRNQWLVGATPGMADSSTRLISFKNDLPYQTAGADAILEDHNIHFRAHLNRLLLPLAWLTLIATAVVLVGVPLGLHYSIAQPLNALLRGIERVEAGDLTVRMPLTYLDEIGLLTESFNQMVGQLRATMDKLEDRVDERTRELASLVQQVTEQSLKFRQIYEVIYASGKPISIDHARMEILESLLSAVKGDAATLHYRQEGRGDLYLVTQRGLTSDEEERVRSVPANWLDIEIKPGVQNHLIDYWKRHPSLIQFPYQTHIGAPAYLEGDVIGFISVFWRGTYSISAEEIAFFNTHIDQLGIIIENKHLRDRIEQLAVQHERHRLARDLHDSVTQSLHSLTLTAETANHLLEQRNMQRMSDVLKMLAVGARQALKEMRLLLYELRSTPLQDTGLVHALQTRFESIERRAGVNGQIIVSENAHWNQNWEQDLYNIATEALNNALKYAHAPRVTVTLDGSATHFQMEIADNGVGFDMSMIATGGMGMNTMRERAESIGGRLDITSAPGEGTRVTVVVKV
ncbi:MAG: HAMP domain-containing protein [Chloroflexi bacterium]|nr:HAMP domain-containing protein [Chloroflexota bacterium]